MVHLLLNFLVTTCHLSTNPNDFPLVFFFSPSFGKISVYLCYFFVVVDSWDEHQCEGGKYSYVFKKFGSRLGMEASLG